MSRRGHLPGAAELLEATAGPDRAPGAAAAVAAGPGSSGSGGLSPTGRERHAQKITVYLSEEELLTLERARLSLRTRYGVAADRGRLVRAAVAVAVADLEEQGDRAAWVRALRAP